MTGTRNGAVALIEALEAQGVTTVFGVPGEETTDVMTAIAQSDLKFVLCRHEQAAAFMASVHGRLTGRPAVCLATLGPGATNLVTGVADAYLDHVPLIAITGQAPRARLKRESHQVIDLETLFAPVTKLSRTLLDADDIPATVAEAARLCLHEKPGPVHLSLPEDVAKDATSMPVIKARPTRFGTPNSTSLKEVADTLSSAQHPVVVAGAGVLRSHASDALRDFVDATSLPVVTTFMAKGLLPIDHPQMLFSLGQPEDDIIDHALDAADLIITVGFDPVEYGTSNLTKDQTPVVALSLTAAPVDSGWQIVADAVGDISKSLRHLKTHLRDQQWPPCPTFEAVRDGMIRQLNREAPSSKDGAVSPHDLCRVISKTLRAEDTMLSGVGLHKLWIARQVIAKRPGQVIVPNGLAGMGLALPGAIAAAQLQEKGRVLAVCGDGDVLMNIQEMETAARLGLRLTIMVWEDGGYGLIDEHQGDSHAEFSFNNPLWSKLTHAFGWSYAHADSVSSAQDILQTALTTEGPTLVSVKVDYAANGGMPTHQSVA